MKLTSVFLFLLVFVLSAQQPKWVNTAFQTAQQQLRLASAGGADSLRIPRSVNNDGSIRVVKIWDWTSGFFPGSLWLLNEYSGDKEWKERAIAWTEILEPLKYSSHTHDLGFMMYCSYGNAYRLTGNEKYKEVILTASRNLMKRFNPSVGCIRSWDRYPWSAKWQYPVIIDNMMNLEMLFFATRVSGDSSFYKVAVTHANTTMQNHFRANSSSYHVTDYDTLTGKVIQHTTHQGISDESSWARGQAWGLYGFTMCYRETKDIRYLEQATKIAQFVLTNPSVPEDHIFFWDYNAPNIPNAPRDASSAAIVASSLLELSTFVPEKKILYFTAAEKILKSLSSPEYMAKKGNYNFILKHCTGNFPEGTEIDKPLNYGDYYFLEALLRYRRLVLSASN
jgi:rhamnogalacturonyl hydrolase YesR